MKKNKNNLSDLFDNKVDNIEKEINELFSELMDHLPINNERLDLLLKKVTLLKAYLENIESDILKHNEKFKTKSKKMRQVEIIVLLVALFTSFININITILSHIIYIICSGINIYYLSKCVTAKKVSEIKNQVKLVNNTLTSCHNFILKRMQENNMNESIIENKELSFEEYANYIIDIYFNTGEVVDMTENLQNYIKTMLQRKLKTQENDLLVLLEMAKTTEFNELILSRNPKKIK